MDWRERAEDVVARRGPWRAERARAGRLAPRQRDDAGGVEMMYADELPHSRSRIAE